MSDARAATDEEIEGWHEQIRDTRERGGSWVPVVAVGLEELLARIAADAARIREMEVRQVPYGWQVVPKEPTRAMHDASDEILSGPSWTGVVPPDCRFDDYVRKLEWAAMLAAAPQP